MSDSTISRIWLFTAVVAGLGSGPTLGQTTPTADVVAEERKTLDAAQKLIEMGKLTEARAAIDAALQRDPGSARAHYLLGMLNERRRDLPAAAAAYERAIQYSPRLTVAHNRLGFVRGQLGETDAAVDHFAKAVALDPAFFEAHYHLGATLR